jgi:DUF4097 and DUF4098 domain-containing protein YvlB
MPKCPHCGRSDPNLLDTIRQMMDNNWGTQVNHENSGEVIAEYSNTISDMEDKLANLVGKPDEEIAWQSGDSKVSVKQDRKYYQDGLEKARAMIAAVKKATSEGYQIADISIEQHNEAGFAILESMKGSGAVIVLSSAV